MIACRRHGVRDAERVVRRLWRARGDGTIEGVPAAGIFNFHTPWMGSNDDGDDSGAMDDASHSSGASSSGTEEDDPSTMARARWAFALTGPEGEKERYNYDWNNILDAQGRPVASKAMQVLEKECSKNMSAAEWWSMKWINGTMPPSGACRSLARSVLIACSKSKRLYVFHNYTCKGAFIQARR